MHPKGKKLALYDTTNFVIIDTLKLNTLHKKYSYPKNFVGINDYRADGQLEIITVIKNKKEYIVTISYFDATALELKKKDSISGTAKVKPSKTMFKNNRIILKKKNGTVLRRYNVSKNYHLSLVK